jgi:hypothetical protein
MGRYKDRAFEQAERRDWNGYAHGERRAGGDLIDEYVYQNADGQPHLRVQRMRFAGVDRDQFPQSHWEDGGWVPGKPQGPPVPYRLPELLAAPPGAQVWLCEGEKDTETLVALGEVATTAPGGAGKWRPELNEWFRERRVVVLPDNDKPGRAHTKKIARNLGGLTVELKVLELPGLDEGGDVTEWMEAGGTLEQLKALAAAVPTYAAGLLKRMNEEFCVVSAQGKARVLSLDEDEDRRVVLLQSFADFKALHDHRRVAVEGDRTIGEGSWWLAQEDRRQYAGLAFRPGRPTEVNGRLNLWQGWGVEPAPGGWSLLKQHIVEVLAAGDATSAEYILKWTAWAFQNPGKPAEVALVLRGGKGSGKGAYARAVKQAFGQHGLQISSATHLTGRFNAHMIDCALLFADEAFWPGDKTAEGTLKRIITEPTLFTEKKGIDAFEVPNVLHIVMAANADWVVPATLDERRFAVFDVAEEHQQEAAYFDPLFAEMEAGGVAAMLHDLLEMDLNGWHPRKDVPRTDALNDQIMRSLKPEEQWWLSLLQAGELPGAHMKDPSLSPSEVLFDHARRTVPGLRHASDHLLGRYLRALGADRDHDWRVQGKRAWHFPALGQARADWAAKLPTRWDAPGAKEWTAPDPNSDEVEW